MFGGADAALHGAEQVGTMYENESTTRGSGPASFSGIHHVHTSHVGAASLDTSSIAGPAGSSTSLNVSALTPSPHGNATERRRQQHKQQPRTPTDGEENMETLDSGTEVGVEPLLQLAHDTLGGIDVEHSRTNAAAAQRNAVRAFDYPIRAVEPNQAREVSRHSSAHAKPAARSTSANTRTQENSGIAEWEHPANLSGVSQKSTGSRVSRKRQKAQSSTSREHQHDTGTGAVNTSVAFGQTRTSHVSFVSSRIGAPPTVVDVARMENYLRQVYDDRLRASVQSVVAAIKEELPRDHVYAQLASDPATEQYCKVRVGEVVEAFLFSVQAHQYHTLASELAKREAEVIQLTSQLDAVANDVRLIESARDDEEAAMAQLTQQVAELRARNDLLFRESEKHREAASHAQRELEQLRQESKQYAVHAQSTVVNTTSHTLHTQGISSTENGGVGSNSNSNSSSGHLVHKDDIMDDASVESNVVEFLQELAREHELARNRECMSILSSLVAMGNARNEYKDKYEFLADVNNHLFKSVMNLCRHVADALGDSAATPVTASAAPSPSRDTATPHSKAQGNPLPAHVLSELVQKYFDATPRGRSASGGASQRVGTPNTSDLFPTRDSHRDTNDTSAAELGVGDISARLRKYEEAQAVVWQLQRQRIAREEKLRLQDMERDLIAIQVDVDRTAHDLRRESDQLKEDAALARKRAAELQAQLPSSEATAGQLLRVVQQQEETLQHLRDERRELLDKLSVLEVTLSETEARAHEHNKEREIVEREAQQQQHEALLAALAGKVEKHITKVSAAPLRQLVEQMEGLERQLQEQRDRYETLRKESDREIEERDNLIHRVLLQLTAALGDAGSGSRMRSNHADAETAENNEHGDGDEDDARDHQTGAAQRPAASTQRPRKEAASGNQVRRRSASTGSRCSVCSERTGESAEATSASGAAAATSLRTPSTMHLSDVPVAKERSTHKSELLRAVSRITEAFAVSKELLRHRDRELSALQHSVAQSTAKQDTQDTQYLQEAQRVAQEYASVNENLQLELTQALEKVREAEESKEVMEAAWHASVEKQEELLRSVAGDRERSAVAALAPTIQRLESETAMAKRDAETAAMSHRLWNAFYARLCNKTMSTAVLRHSSEGPWNTVEIPIVAAHTYAQFLEASLQRSEFFAECSARIVADAHQQRLSSERDKCRAAEEKAAHLEEVLKDSNSTVKRVHRSLQDAVKSAERALVQHKLEGGKESAAEAGTRASSLASETFSTTSLDITDVATVALGDLADLRERYAASSSLSGVATAAVMLLTSLRHRVEQLTRKLEQSTLDERRVIHQLNEEVDTWKVRVEQLVKAHAKERMELQSNVDRLEEEQKWLLGSAAENNRKEMQDLLRRQEDVLEKISEERNELKRRWHALSWEYQRLERRNGELHDRCTSREKENARLAGLLKGTSLDNSRVASNSPSNMRYPSPQQLMQVGRSSSSYLRANISRTHTREVDDISEIVADAPADRFTYTRRVPTPVSPETRRLRDGGMSILSKLTAPGSEGNDAVDFNLPHSTSRIAHIAEGQTSASRMHRSPDQHSQRGVYTEPRSGVRDVSANATLGTPPRSFLADDPSRRQLFSGVTTTTNLRSGVDVESGLPRSHTNTPSKQISEYVPVTSGRSTSDTRHQMFGTSATLDRVSPDRHAVNPPPDFTSRPL